MALAASSSSEQHADSSVNQAQFDQRISDVIRKAIARNIPGLPPLPLTESDLEVGTSEKELVFTRDTARLYHFAPLTDEVYRVPMLIVMSPIAKGYILDLAKGQSFVEYFLKQGHDVYMIDWAAPRAEHKDLDLANYVCDLVGDCVNKVAEDSGEDDVTLVGYCMGGVLSICYAAMYPDGPVKNLACFATPVNGDGMVLFKKWINSNSFDIDEIVAELGNIPTEMINASLQALRPLQKNANQLKLLNNVHNDAFVTAHLRFDRWSFDQLPFPGALAKDYSNGVIRDNLLVNNELTLRGKKIDFKDIVVPFLHVAAKFDHIVPAAASKDLIDMIGSEDKEEITVKGGHVSLVAGGNAIYRLWPKLDEWLSDRAT